MLLLFVRQQLIHFLTIDDGIEYINYIHYCNGNLDLPLTEFWPAINFFKLDIYKTLACSNKNPLIKIGDPYTYLSPAKLISVSCSTSVRMNGNLTNNNMDISVNLYWNISNRVIARSPPVLCQGQCMQSSQLLESCLEILRDNKWAVGTEDCQSNGPCWCWGLYKVSLLWSF